MESELERGGSAQPPRLYPVDQHRVDAVVSRGVNRVERAPFRPWLLLTGIWLLLLLLSAFSLWMGWIYQI